jgi:hypothetical protein
MLFVGAPRALLMRVLRTIVCSIPLLAAVPAVHAADSDEVSGLCKVDSLPQDIKSSLSRNFAAWKVVEPGDLSVRGRTRWGAQRPLTCPGIAAGHFQDPRNSSYALLLIVANHSSSMVRLVIYTQQSGPYYGFKSAAQQDTGAGDLFIAAAPVTRYFDSSSKWTHSKLTEAVRVGGKPVRA